MCKPIEDSPTKIVESIGELIDVVMGEPSLDTNPHAPDIQPNTSSNSLAQNVGTPMPSPAPATVPQSPSPEPTTEKRWIRTRGTKRDTYREPCPKCEIVIPELERTNKDRIIACSGVECSIILVS
jgi:hypothetical protein